MFNCIPPAASYFKTMSIIQNKVRIPESLYASNIASLNVYELPLKENAYVNWNQMSDRCIPHEQPNRIKRTETRPRPGACSPGGVGVDIKHNSYARYINRIKGKNLAKNIPCNNKKCFV